MNWMPALLSIPNKNLMTNITAMIIIVITININRPLRPRFPINANSELLIDCLPASSNVGGCVKLWNNLAFVDISNQYIFEDHQPNLCIVMSTLIFFIYLYSPLSSILNQLFHLIID